MKNLNVAFWASYAVWVCVCVFVRWVREMWAKQNRELRKKERTKERESGRERIRDGGGKESCVPIY
jgi:hypothetical protein